MKRTKIICTLGPASSSLDKIIALARNGMNIARLNFSHGSYEDHRKRIDLVRKASKTLGVEISILQDLQGPKIRIGELATGSVELVVGKTLEIGTKEKIGTVDSISTTYTNIVNDVSVGDTILIDDGLLNVKVLQKEKDKIITEVVIGGVLKSKKGLNLPDVEISMPSLTKKDLEDVEFGLEHGVDLIALSFVRSADDIENLRKIIVSKGKDTWIIAKIEKPQAIKHIDAIIEASNAVMVARGDLGVEVKGHQVPVLQKEIVRKCNLMNKPVIIATQMLETMTQNPVPTRAEASDVANAVFDGTDAVMLSAETASGQYPIESVRVMSDIIKNVEASPAYLVAGDRPRRSTDLAADKDIAQAIATSVVNVARNVEARAIIVLSHSGQTAVRVSKQRSNIPIFVVTDRKEVHHRMSLLWGATSLYTKRFKKAAEMFDFVEIRLKHLDAVKVGDKIVYTMGIPVLNRGTTDTIKISTIE
ncbi:hypothetical protein CHS0354_024027 [Potamilus streckersoni]|uniref:Pyruvate kinase n=1 Tax=Potamilus streckersoni TaxID=2493646 RepID=A0AAE0VMT9_9BIVA|nr:hypothetical protein CHS0354_024027 [Potamilus streckersoni]